jgi:hypothetical protein
VLAISDQLRSPSALGTLGSVISDVDEKRPADALIPNADSSEQLNLTFSEPYSKTFSMLMDRMETTKIWSR